ncbi:YppG family protein [Saliterribacillus persicus]|uniref:YppG-like protein n=1 Tax=Saliterribacillus persicus TaxID=930114 RepID=A0A368XYG3_9BACI|nr:YppG family protein [Saliterribacillus persicus]RCW73041.1 YppG-like protein [Saliterribacillus persicus]
MYPYHPNQGPPGYPQQIHSPYHSYQQYPVAPFSNPYHQSYPQSMQQKQAVSNFITVFQDENGQIDIDKVLDTIGQLNATYQQISPVVKSFGNIIKGIK